MSTPSRGSSLPLAESPQGLLEHPSIFVIWEVECAPCLRNFWIYWCLQKWWNCRVCRLLFTVMPCSEGTVHCSDSIPTYFMDGHIECALWQQNLLQSSCVLSTPVFQAVVGCIQVFFSFHKCLLSSFSGIKSWAGLLITKDQQDLAWLTVWYGPAIEN